MSGGSRHVRGSQDTGIFRAPKMEDFFGLTSVNLYSSICRYPHSITTFVEHNTLSITVRLTLPLKNISPRKARQLQFDSLILSPSSTRTSRGSLKTGYHSRIATAKYTSKPILYRRHSSR